VSTSSDSKAGFLSLYRHGFARVAACTGRSHPGDPARNGESVLALAQTCHEAGAAVAVFPELALSAYAIEDLLLQQPLLDAVEAAAALLQSLQRRIGASHGAIASIAAEARQERPHETPRETPHESPHETPQKTRQETRPETDR